MHFSRTLLVVSEHITSVECTLNLYSNVRRSERNVCNTYICATYDVRYFVHYVQSVMVDISYITGFLMIVKVMSDIFPGGLDS